MTIDDRATIRGTSFHRINEAVRSNLRVIKGNRDGIREASEAVVPLGKGVEDGERTVSIVEFMSLSQTASMRRLGVISGLFLFSACYTRPESGDSGETDTDFAESSSGGEGAEDGETGDEEASEDGIAGDESTEDGG